MNLSPQRKKSLKKILYIIFIVILISDTGYSFKQYLANPLDWDMAGGILPAENVKPILNNPLGIDAILNNTKYPNPNRFFSHWAFYTYFNTMPFFLQKFMSPIASVYWSCAIAKILLHISFLVVLGILFSGNNKIFSFGFLLFLIILTPLFQVYGYQNHMGIVDKSNTYLFFYPLPLLLLILYYIPFVFNNYYRHKIKLNAFLKVVWIFLAFIICLSGPLNPGINLIIILLVFMQLFYKNHKEYRGTGIANQIIKFIKRIPADYYFYFLPVFFLSVYSLILGTHNDVNDLYEIPLSEIYLKLPNGIIHQFTQKPGFPVLFFLITINIILLHKVFPKEEKSSLLNNYFWILCFCLIYIFLLPLGGYRDYRPHILRYDTILPITILIFYVYVSSSIELIKKLSLKKDLLYIPLVLLVSFIFTNADKTNFKENLCEKKAILQIASSQGDTVRLNCDCNVLSWKKVMDINENRLNSELLMKWNITSRLKYFSNNYD